MEDPHNWCPRNATFLWEMECWFSGGFLKALLQFLNILRNDGWTMSTTVAFVGICRASCLRSLATKRWIVLLSGKLFLPKCLLHCHCVRTDFVIKVRLNDFYPLLNSIASSWIHISVKRISQGCCLYHLKNMGKNCKAQLWDENKIGRFFGDHPVQQGYNLKTLDNEWSHDMV